MNAKGNGLVIIILAHILIFTTGIIATIRFILSYRQRIAFKYDDATFAVAVVLAIAESSCFVRAVGHGLGHHISSVSAQDLSAYYKLMYSGKIVGILTMCFAKVSVLMLFFRIAREPGRRFIWTGIAVIAWMLFSVFALAFKCRLPSPWKTEPGNCPAGELEYPVIVVNMVTDVALSAAILPIIWRMQVARKTRFIITSLFGSRLIVPLFAIAQLVATTRGVKSMDQTWANANVVVWEIVVVHLSVILSTIPRAHSFWVSLQGGFIETPSNHQDEHELQNVKRFQPSKTSFSTSTRATSSHSANKDNEPNTHPPNEPLKLVPSYAGITRTRIYAGSQTSGRQIGSAQSSLSPNAFRTDRDDDVMSLHSLRDMYEHNTVWKHNEVTVEVEVRGRERRWSQDQ